MPVYKLKPKHKLSKEDVMEAELKTLLSWLKEKNIEKNSAIVSCCDFLINEMEAKRYD